MAKVELGAVEIDTKKVYKVSDKFVFTLTLNCAETIPDDVEFEIIYFGDAYSDNHDQKIGFSAVGPLQKGKQFFQLETEPIDLTKIPIKTLFGLTTILIVGKYKEQQFLRIGYVVNVSYPGMSSDDFMDSNDVAIADNIDAEEVEEEEEDLEVMNDDEIDNDEEEDEDDNDEEEDEDDNDEEDEEEEDDEEDDEDDSELVTDDEEEVSLPTGGIQNVLESCFAKNNSRDPIPLETPIISGKDEFEFKGKELKQSMIELTLHESPIIHVFEIDWDDNKVQEDNIVESSENADNSPAKEKINCADEDVNIKKTKL